MIFHRLLVSKRVKALLNPKTLAKHNECKRVLSHHIRMFESFLSVAKEIKENLPTHNLKEILIYFQYLGINNKNSMQKTYQGLREAYGGLGKINDVIMDILESSIPKGNGSDILTISLCLFPLFTIKESKWIFDYLDKAYPEPPVIISTSVLAKTLLLIMAKGKLKNPPIILNYLQKVKLHPSLQLPSDICTLYAPSWSSDVNSDTCYKIASLVMLPEYCKTYSNSKAVERAEEFVEGLFNSTIGLPRLLQDANNPQEFIANNQQSDACRRCGAIIGPVCTCIHCGLTKIISSDGTDRSACTASSTILSKDQIIDLGSRFISKEYVTPILVANNINTIGMIKAVEAAITNFSKLGNEKGFRALDESLTKSKDMSNMLINLHGVFQSTLSQITNHLNSKRSCIEASTKATQEFTTSLNIHTQEINKLSPMGHEDKATIVKEVIDFLTRDPRDQDVLITNDIVNRVLANDEDVLYDLGLCYEDES